MTVSAGGGAPRITGEIAQDRVLGELVGDAAGVHIEPVLGERDLQDLDRVTSVA